MSANASKFTFTRYLYIKDEVHIALLISILNKSEKSLFWAYELYYSGFDEELFGLLWKIYFDFYYTLNPGFYKYFIKKQKEWSKAEDSFEKHKTIGVIVNNLSMRPHNMDVFLLRYIVSNFDIETETNSAVQVTEWLDQKKYLNIADYIFNKCVSTVELNTALQQITNYFKERNVKVDESEKNVGLNQKHIALANVMLMFSHSEKLTIGKNMYLIVEDKEILKHNTMESDYDNSFYPYKILPLVTLHGIDEDNYLSLFELQRETLDLKDAYYYHWDYYAFRSPLWKLRVEAFNGCANHETKRLEFPDDDYFEDFYNKYNYEPDEQKTETQNKNIQTIRQRRTWVQFYEQHKKNGLYIPDEDYLDEFDKVNY
jgi:hypothetical protein